MEKFKKPEANPLLNPVDYFNFHGSFVSIFDGVKKVNIKSETEICLQHPDNLDPNELNKVTFTLNKNNVVEVVKKNDYQLAVGAKLSKFMLLSAVKFKGDNFAAMSYVHFTLMKSEIPYIRVGTDYFKLIDKKDRFGSHNRLLKPWKKDEIKQDHGKQLLNMIFKFDDFLGVQAKFPQQCAPRLNCSLMISHTDFTWLIHALISLLGFTADWASRLNWVITLARDARATHRLLDFSLLNLSSHSC